MKSTKFIVYIYSDKKAGRIFKLDEKLIGKGLPFNSLDLDINKILDYIKQNLEGGN